MSITAKEHGPDPVDVHVGKRLHLRRTLLGISQDQLATAVGVSFQQIQKYERGVNRVSASRLYDIARVLGVSISFFFEDITTAVTAARPSQTLPEQAGIQAGRTPAEPGAETVPTAVLALAADLRRLSAVQQRAVTDLIAALARPGREDPAHV